MTVYMKPQLTYKKNKQVYSDSRRTLTFRNITVQMKPFPSVQNKPIRTRARDSEDRRTNMHHKAYLLQLPFSPVQMSRTFSFFKVSFLPFTLFWSKRHGPALIAHLGSHFLSPTCQDTFLCAALMAHCS